MLLKASEVDAPLALCVLVLIVSNGCVAKTVMTPATAPVPNVVAVFCGSPWAFDSSFSWLYDPILTPEVADCFIVVDTSPLYRSRTPCSCAISLMAWKLPLKRFAFFASSILFEISWRVMDRETILTRRSSVFLLEWRQLHSQHIQPPYRRWSHFQSKACRQSPLTLTWLCRMLRTSHSLWTRCPTLLVSWITCGQGGSLHTTTSVEQPVYSAETPSLRTTFCNVRMIPCCGPSDLSCDRVFKNSVGYCLIWASFKEYWWNAYCHCRLYTTCNTSSS